MFWVFGMIIGAITYAICDGAMSAIRDVRTREAGPPYKDFYHLLLHVGRLSLIFATFSATRIDLPWYYVLVLALPSILLGDQLWRCVKEDEWFWVALDDRIHVSTGIRWLDKWLGMHW